jgi:hypothetical protein
MRFAVAFALAAFGAAADPPRPDLWGVYAPGGDCGREPRVEIDAEGARVVAGGRRTKITPLDFCFACAGGAAYEGPEVWMSNLANGEPQVVFRLNADDVIGAMDIYNNSGGSVDPALAQVIAATPLARCR